MHNYPLLIALGLLLGAFGTLVGAGGGFILAPVLLLLYPTDDADTLTSISLFVVFINALSGTRAYARMGRIDYRSGVLFAAAGLPGAVLGAVTTTFIARWFFDDIVGVALIGAAVLLIATTSTKERAQHSANAPHTPLPDPLHCVVTRRKVKDGSAGLPATARPVRLGMLLSAFVGYISSLLGIGGGIIHVPMMAKILGFPVHIATATSHFVLAIMALTGTMTHVFTGAFHHGIRRAVAIAIGAAIGAPLGAYVSNRIASAWIIRALAAALALVGLRLLFAT